jgi:hypothetical protein
VAYGGVQMVPVGQREVAYQQMSFEQPPVDSVIANIPPESLKRGDSKTNYVYVEVEEVAPPNPSLKNVS